MQKEIRSYRTDVYNQVQVIYKGILTENNKYGPNSTWWNAQQIPNGEHSRSPMVSTADCQQLHDDEDMVLNIDLEAIKLELS